jgi:hypothetical protein
MNYPGQKEEIKFFTPLTLKDGSQLTSVYMRDGRKPDNNGGIW